MIGEALSAKTLVQEYTFSGPGNYEVKAVAKAGDDKAESVEMYCYASDSQQAGYPGGTPKMGPVKNSDGSVTFCLGIPGKSSVILVGGMERLSGKQRACDELYGRRRNALFLGDCEGS